MPAQFAPRGGAALQAAQEMGQQMLQAAAIRAANERAARERQMRQQMQAQAIAAEQAQMGQAALLQAARDARLSEYDLQKIDALSKQRQAEQDYEATGGYSALEIEQIAASKGMPSGMARRMLIEQKQAKDRKTAIDQNYEEWKTRAKAGVDVQESKQIEALEKEGIYLKGMLSKASPASKPAIEKALQDWEAKKAGLPKAPRPPSFEETFRQNSKQLPNGDVIFKDPDTKKITHVRAGNSAGGAQSTAKQKQMESIFPDPKSAEPTPEEIDAELERGFAGQSGMVWNSAKKENETRKLRASDADPESRELAASMVRLRKYDMAIRTTLAMYLIEKKHMSPEQAQAEASRMISEAQTAQQANELIERAKQYRIYNSFLRANGQPIPEGFRTETQPAGEDPSVVEEARRALANPNLPPELRAQIEAQLRGQ